jgi:hypothetical protein
MTFWEFAGQHPILTVILGMLAVSAIAALRGGGCGRDSDAK